MMIRKAVADYPLAMIALGEASALKADDEASEEEEEADDAGAD